MYAVAITEVRLKNGVSKEFEMKVVVQQRSVLSPLLFIIVMEALSSSIQKRLSYELLYAEDGRPSAGG